MPSVFVAVRVLPGSADALQTVFGSGTQLTVLLAADSVGSAAHVAMQSSWRSSGSDDDDGSVAGGSVAG